MFSPAAERVSEQRTHSMDLNEFPPPPPPEMFVEDSPLPEEEEGERFDFDDSGDEVPEADRPPPTPPAADSGPQRPTKDEAGEDRPTPREVQALSPANSKSAAPQDPEGDLPPPAAGPVGSCADAAPSEPELDLPPPPPPENCVGSLTDHAPAAEADPASRATVRETPQGKVSPYSVIDIAPLQHPLPAPPPSSSPEPEPGIPDEPPVPLGYSVPVSCGYAVPSNVPAIAPAYTTPVIIRHLSMDEDVTVVRTCSAPVDSEEHPVIREEDALSRWVSDPANTAWMDNPDEVIYDDVPRENSDSTTDPEEMIYDDVELGDEGGSSSPDNGWSSSEFESYDEHSDGDGQDRNGLPDAFVRGRTPRSKTHLSQDLTRLKEHYERKVKDLMANTVGTVELQQIRQKQEQKMQKLVKAAKDGTKDGLEKTKAVVKKGKSFIKTKSFCQERKCLMEDEEGDLFIEVECFNVEPVLCPMPEGLSEQQVVRRYILQSILESEKNYVEALKRILEHYERPLSEMDPRLLSERKLKMTFYRVREILQCHALFQIALASRVAEWDASEMIGDVFVASFSKSMVLDAYSEYVNNFSTAMGVLKKTCASKPAFVEFLKHCQESSGDRVTLYGLMMKPIQRFPQFILLLQDMLKNTPVGHADRLPLQMALTELETLADKLNEKKREADQRCEVKHIAKAMNERYLNKLLSSDSRYLIRSDDMVETVYNDRGEMVKTKERRVFLLNDVLMCATANVRSSQDNTGGSSSGASQGQKLLLKWSVPLSLVDVVEFGSSEEAADGGRYVPPHSGENVVINARPNKLYVGPGQLYQDLQNLVHDLGLVKHISSMIGSLKGNYQNVNSAVAQDWVSGLQRLILKKEEEIRAADRCRIQLQLPGKHDKSGRPTHFTAVFNTFTPAVKQWWISSLQMAKLALEEDNLQGWFFAEDDGNQMKKRKHPLLLRQMPVVMSKLQEFKVECAVHNPEPLYNTESTADTPALGYGCVWVASCSNQMGQISVISLQNPTPKVTECFNVESRILCMVHVPPNPLQEAEGAETPTDSAPCGRGSDTPTVCLGMEEGSISVYKSSQLSKKVRLQHFFMPDKSTVMSLVFTARCLFAGLVSGAVAIFSRLPDGSWCAESPTVVKLGVLPVKSMLAVEDHVWASSGGQVFIICTKTHSIKRQLEAHQEEGMVVSQMVVAGVGIWIAFSARSTLRLFHTETLEHLQDINIATPVHSMLSGQQRVLVSSLLVCHGLLLVGTNLGVTVALSVPRLQGIPKVTGRGMVSFHAHNGPVRFLIMAAAVCNRPPGDPSVTQPTSSSNDDPATDPEPSDPAQTMTQPHRDRERERGVWLGESSGCQASLSSSNNSLVPSQSSLEHGPEDGGIYDLLNDPAHSHWGRRTVERVTAGSVLAISGGAGHRRVNRKSKQSRQEEATATIMVWQIPLLSL